MGAPAQILGPYTIDKRLGAGGMGEVYQAYDERLDRWVAIKLIRGEAAEDATARERFRREARAAARLSHPSIVQIHDILESGEGHAIVMELVEGEPLSQRLARGPLAIEEAVRLGREIADGLAAAHARGIIHRDLKPDNVMITPEGRAKILDFGLAKTLAGDASLTADQRVVGTFRSMSPEQAKGLPLDTRSDLFSLGILLYEMLSGRSPFDGGTALETLTRICTCRQTPLRELSPAIPESLSDLVDQLLAKEPERRPRSARETAQRLARLSAPGGVSSLSGWSEEETWSELAPPGASPARHERPFPSPERASQAQRAPWAKGRWLALSAALLLLTTSLGLLLLRRAPREPMLAVAVLAPQTSGSGDPERVELAAAGLRVALLRSVLSLESVSLLAPEQVDAVSGPPATVARAAAADEVVTSRLSCNPQVCQVAISRVRGADGRLLWTQGFEVPVEEPYLLAEAAEGYLQKAYTHRRVRSDAPPLAISSRDYAEFLRLRHAYESQSADLATPELLDRLRGVRRRAPRFLEAAILEADVLRYRFQSLRDPADLQRSFDVLNQARELAPGDPRPLLHLVELSLKTQRLGLTETYVRELERLQPGDPFVAMQRARLLERRGQTQQALALSRAAVRRRPSWALLFRLADMEYRLGESEPAKLHLWQLLQRFPGHYAGESLLAQIELQYGSPQRAAAMYESLVRRSPLTAELTNLGTAYLLLKRYAEAERSFRWTLKLEPESPFATLNLADVLFLEGRRREAETLYRRLLVLAANDPAASHWQFLSLRAQALAHLGRTSDAVEAAQQVLPAAHDNPQAMFEVSLVYALVGDNASARLNAGKALARGVEPRWFEFPWFDSLRGSPEFETLLAARAAKVRRP